MSRIMIYNPEVMMAYRSNPLVTDAGGTDLDFLENLQTFIQGIMDYVNLDDLHQSYQSHINLYII